MRTQKYMLGTALTAALLWTTGALAQTPPSVDAGLGLTSKQSVARKPAPPKKTIIVPPRQNTKGAAWTSSAKAAEQPAEAYPYYTMVGLFAAVCNAPYARAKRDCPNMSSVQALGALQLMMYYGNLIGPDSVLVVMPKAKLGALTGENGDAKLNQMTRAFRQKNSAGTSVAKAN